MKLILGILGLCMFGACVKTETPDIARLQYNVAYIAICDSCSVTYRIQDGSMKTVQVEGLFSSEVMDSILVESDFEAYVYAETKTANSPKSIQIFSPSDTSIHFKKTPRGNEPIIRLAWLIPRP